MKVTSKLFVFALILSLILTVGAVAAAEDMSFDQSDEEAVLQETDMELDTSQDNDDEKLSASEADDDLNSPIGGGQNQLLSDIHTVTGENFTDIQTAINSANAGDTIFLEGKTYKGSAQINVNVDNLTIVGGYQAHPDIVATLDAQGLFTRIMSITASNVIIKNVKFINGNVSGDGGAIHWSGANGTLKDSIFTDNNASKTGGAVYWPGANASVINCNFVNNEAGNGGALGFVTTSPNARVEGSNFKANAARYSGGAIYWNSLNATLINSNFYDNVAETVGAVYFLQNSVNSTITDCNFINNAASGSYGAFLIWNGFNSTLKNSKFINNTAGGQAGAAYWNAANFTIDNCEFINNSASASKGALGISSVNNGKLINCLFEGNKAVVGHGGAIYTDASDSLIENCTFIKNYAQQNTGAVVLNGNNHILNNCKFIENHADKDNGAFSVSGNAKENISLIHCTFDGNSADNAYGVGNLNFVANAVVNDCIFTNNFGASGAFRIGGPNCIVTDSYFESNNCNDINSDGGALYWNSANGILKNTKFINNSAYKSGGAVYWVGANASVSNCSFIDNTAIRDAGGALCFVSTSNNTSVRDCIFEGNAAKSSGGAVYWNSLNATMVNCNFTDNAATNGGAVRFLANCANSELSDCNFFNNSASNSAGAIWWDGKDSKLYNLNFVNNSAVGNVGGAIYSSANNITIDFASFIDNSAKNGAGAIDLRGHNVILSDLIFNNNSADLGGAIRSLGENTTVSHSQFMDNHAVNDAGATYFGAANANLIDCYFNNNSATWGGSSYFHANAVNSTVSNCTFENSNATANGGSIWCNGANATIKDSKFINSYADYNGGAILFNAAASNSVLDTCEFRNNFAGNSGGAVYTAQSTNVTITNCEFTNNTAANWGGAIIMKSDSATVKDSKFNENSAHSGGGAVNWDGINGTIYNNEFRNNFANLTGGALRIHGVNATVDECEFINNLANQSGGALFVYDVATNATIKNSEFFDNSAKGEGGAITINGNNATVDDCDFIKNNADLGGAIHTTGEGVVIKNSELVDNEAKYSGNAIWVDGPFNSIISNSIDNQKSDKPAIHVTNNHDLKLEGNEFTGNKNEVAYAEIIIDVADTFIGHLGQTVVIPVYVHDNYGNPLSGEVSLYGHNAEYLVDGRANLTMTMPTVEATQTLVVLYSSLHKVIQVVPADTKNPIDEIKQPSGDSDQLEIDFPADATGNVTVIINGKEYYAIVKDGKAVVDLKETPNGNYPATVIYSGDGNYSGMTKVIQVTVKNSEINPTYMISENKDITVVYSGKATYKVLVTKNGKAVGAGESVTINFNGQNINVKTDAKGYVTLNLNTNIKVGTYNVKTTYKGVSVTNKVKINQIIKASNKKVKKSKKVTKIKVSLAKVDGKFLAKKTLKIKFNKKTYKVKTNKKGVGTWKVKKSMLKKLKVGKKVKYTVTYGKATLTKKLTIKK